MELDKRVHVLQILHVSSLERAQVVERGCGGEESFL
jgi:hypothetical protein